MMQTCTKKGSDNLAVQSAAFTLIEVIFVVSLMLITFAVALPNFTIITSTDTAEKLGQLAVDIRSAYDMAVLHRKPHRLVFNLLTGQYHLEVADREDIYVSDARSPKDPTADEEKAESESFNESFKEYTNLAGQEYKDSDSEKVIKPFSPVIEAKNQLAPAQWTRLENTEWKQRSIGPELFIKTMRAEHHETDQTAESLGSEGRAMLYFFPQGYAEQCVMIIAYRLTGAEVDTSREPYTLKVNSYDGTAEIVSGEGTTELKESQNDK